MIREFLDVTGLNEFFKHLKNLLAKKVDTRTLQGYFQVVEIEDNLLAVCDKDSNVVCLIDANGKVCHPLGTVTQNLKVDGDILVGDVRILQGDEGSIFTLLDSEGHMLIWTNYNGTIDFNGIPRDVKSEIEALKSRVSALENPIS